MTDRIFEEEQAHLTKTWNQLKQIEQDLQAALKERMQDALKDKEDMLDELTLDLGNDVDTETYVEIEAVHKIIDAYNLANDIDGERLTKAKLLLKQPYFAKLTLQFKPDSPAREVYIGNAGMTNDNRRHFIVDWRSPVAEVYYNQAQGKTSYNANGRIIECDLQGRRQFDIEGSVLNACFDTTVAIEDPLLLASLSKQRSDKMSDITATIQKEQNQVIRHEDVPTLLVNGIAGSGKTSVLLQRIAYLLYQERETLDPKDVYLITPNKVFEDYISNVLPDMGEGNPQTMTWEELLAQLGLDNRGAGKDVTGDSLRDIDLIIPALRLDKKDFKDLRVADEVVIPAGQAYNAWMKFKKFPAGPHRSSLVIDELLDRLEQRINRLSADEGMQNLVSEFSDTEQINHFGQYIDSNDEEELKKFTRKYLTKRYEGMVDAIESCEWLRYERIGMGMLGKESLTCSELLYLKCALTGPGRANARYVMIDEVQDYTVPQLMTLARFFGNAHFLLLGDPNQAITEGTASFAQITDIFAAEHGPVRECQLMTSYRSSPEITALFAQLAEDDGQMSINSVQRPGTEPRILGFDSKDAYVQELRDSVQAAAQAGGLAAVIAAGKSSLRQVAKLLEGCDVVTPSGDVKLPSSGVVLVDVKLAKGLEFDEVIIPDATSQEYGSDAVSRHRLYTAISRSTQRLTIMHLGQEAELLTRL